MANFYLLPPPRFSSHEERAEAGRLEHSADSELMRRKEKFWGLPLQWLEERLAGTQRSQRCCPAAQGGEGWARAGQ